ncbi:MAG: hypothetical protein J1D85_08380 [Bacteroidales bacterium]|nr:hypothetical protein [Bacteroidales bacterium]
MLCSTKGSSGKGSLCALMRNLCGPGAYANIPLADFGKEFGLEPLLRATAIIADKNDAGTYIDGAANLKAVITSDTILVSRKFKLPVAFRFHGLMVQGLNGMPRLKDRSDSFWRRQLFIPFTQCFAGVEREYIREDYLNRSEVLEYVLWKVLNMSYYQLSEPTACKVASNEYKKSGDPLAQFIEEILPQCVWDLLPLEFLYDLYRAWMRRNSPSDTLLGKCGFAKELEEKVNRLPDWTFGRDKIYRTGHLLDKYEPLVDEYGLTNWANMSFPPALNGKKSGYRGLRRVTVQSGTADDK